MIFVGIASVLHFCFLILDCQSESVKAWFSLTNAFVSDLSCFLFELLLMKIAVFTRWRRNSWSKSLCLAWLVPRWVTVFSVKKHAPRPTQHKPIPSVGRWNEYLGQSGGGVGVYRHMAWYTSSHSSLAVFVEFLAERVRLTEIIADFVNSDLSTLYKSFTYLFTYLGVISHKYAFFVKKVCCLQSTRKCKQESETTETASWGPIYKISYERLVIVLR